MNKQLVKTARELRETGVETSRETAAEVLAKAGRQLKQQSKKAGQFIEERGQQVGSRLETRASNMRNRGGPAPVRYLKSHPFQGLLLAGLVLAILGAFVMPILARGQHEGDEDYFALP
jgi:ElaB/YqjD/DUF883 family membrane-anchored ribosome-binding protein